MRLSWDDIGSRLYNAGVDRGVLYPYVGGYYDNGVAWNGLTGVDDSSSGYEKTLLYTNDIRSGVVFSPKEFGGTIKCYTYPDEFESCIGNEELVPGLFAQENEGVPFGFSYRTKIGNDISANHAYVIHLIYGAHVTEAKENASTIADNPNVTDLSFSFDCVPTEYKNRKLCSHFKINSRLVSQETLLALEEILYGSAESEPRMPFPDELEELLSQDNQEEL